MTRTRTKSAVDYHTAPYFLAGQKVPAGTYLEIDSGREVLLEHEERLPATLDGHVATYVPRPATWAELQRRRADEHRRADRR